MLSVTRPLCAPGAAFTWIGIVCGGGRAWTTPKKFAGTIEIPGGAETSATEGVPENLLIGVSVRFVWPGVPPGQAVTLAGANVPRMSGVTTTTVIGKFFDTMPNC